MTMNPLPPDGREPTDAKAPILDAADIAAMDNPHMSNNSDPINYRALLNRLDAADEEAKKLLDEDLALDC